MQTNVWLTFCGLRVVAMALEHAAEHAELP